MTPSHDRSTTPIGHSDAAPEAAPDILLRWSRTADSEALRELFRRAFAGEMSDAEWAWKYPQPDGFSLLALREGRVVAHYGGQARRLVCRGRPLAAVQVSDIMVDPMALATLGRGTLFRKIATTFAAATAGPDRSHAFVFGFPAPRASRLGERLGMYVRVGALWRCRWAPPQRGARRLRWLDLAKLAAHGDALWRRQATRLAGEHALCVRDAAWVRQRYAEHPCGAYRALARVDAWGRPLAAAVMRRHDDAWELIDLLGEPRHYRRLTLGLAWQAQEQAGLPLVGWLTPAVLEWLPEPQATPSAEPEGRADVDWLPVNIAGPGSHAWAPQLEGHCWMTGGDTDYR